PRSSCRRCAVHGPAPPGVRPLSLHDALPISPPLLNVLSEQGLPTSTSLLSTSTAGSSGSCPPLSTRPPSSALSSATIASPVLRQDRKSTRLNSSHVKSSYAVCCSKKRRAPSP